VLGTAGIVRDGALSDRAGDRISEEVQTSGRARKKQDLRLRF